MIYGCSSYGPVWGYNSNYVTGALSQGKTMNKKGKKTKHSYFGLCISNNCLSNNSTSNYQCSFNPKGKSASLSKKNIFIVEDYETYELTLE